MKRSIWCSRLATAALALPLALAMVPAPALAETGAAQPSLEGYSDAYPHGDFTLAAGEMSADKKSVTYTVTFEDGTETKVEVAADNGWSAANVTLDKFKDLDAIVRTTLDNAMGDYADVDAIRLGIRAELKDSSKTEMVYEVHPEAQAEAKGAQILAVELGNDDLAKGSDDDPNAFLVRLNVGSLDTYEGDTIYIDHVSEDEDHSPESTHEEAKKDEDGNLVVEFWLDHFSTITLSQVYDAGEDPFGYIDIAFGSEYEEGKQQEKTYGEPNEPHVDFSDGEILSGLAEGYDYVVTYKDQDGNELEGRPTHVGIYDAVFTFQGDNYKGEVVRTLEIHPRKLTVSTPNISKAYDGKALTYKASQINKDGLVDGETLVVTSSGTQTDAGTSNDSLIVDWDASGTTALASDYDLTIEPGTLTVTKAPLTVTTPSATKTYDGKALTEISGAKLTGLASGETAELVVTGTITEAGTARNTYRIEWNGTAKESNYSISKEDLGTLTVEAAKSDKKQDAAKASDDDTLASTGDVAAPQAVLLTLAAAGCAAIALGTLRRHSEQ